MELDFNNLENTLFEVIDQVKVLLDQETWDNILMNCSKNEMFVLILLYRFDDVNMSQIADYINIPLNTATGVISRMEKKGMLVRVRSTTDKRVVTIKLTQLGQTQINDIVNAYMVYGKQIVTSLSSDELKVLTKVFSKVIELVQTDIKTEVQTRPKVRKITID